MTQFNAKTKILVIGNSGFLGSYLSSALNDKNLHTDSIGRDVIDLSKPIQSDFIQLLHKTNYNYAVICSAITDVEKCFNDQTLSHQVNVKGTIDLLKVLQDKKITPIFFSSDYVFHSNEAIHTENDSPDPKTCYGQQKLEVENFLENNIENFLIFRTSKLMSKTSHAKNILFPILKNLSANKTTHAFEDQWLNPVFIEDISEVIKRSRDSQLNGIFHLGTRQIFTRYELGQFLASSLGYDPNLIQPIKMQNMTFSEPRPSHNTLNCKKIENALDFKFTEIADALKELKLLA